MAPPYKQLGITAFAFDFDGTLAVPTLDFAVMRKEAIQAVQQITDRPVTTDKPIMETLAELNSVLSPEQAGRVHEAAYRVIREVELEAAGRSALFPFVLPMLEIFREKNIKVAIVTRNCPQAVRTVFPDIDAWCPCLFTRDDVARVKPHTEHLEAALACLDVNPAAAMMVGDHPMDIVVGKNTGTWTAGVASGEASLEQLLEEQPDFTCADAGELMRRLGLLR